MTDEATLAARMDILNREADKRAAPGAPYRRPRDAATLILLDGADGAPKVLMGRRNTKHAFMPGMFVFPGGAIDPGDRRMAAHGDLDAASARRLVAHVKRPSASRARALALAAIRETFEETGLLIGEAAAAPFAAPSPHWAGFATRGVRPSLAALRFVARAITPPQRPRRFDTRFFLADARAIGARVEGIVGPDAELIELVWIPLAEATSLPIPVITRVVLAEIGDRVAGGLDHDRPVSFYRMRHGRFARIVLD